MNTEPDILVDQRDSGLVWITINRAHKHNALARPVLDALADAVRTAGAAAATRCIVLRGAGDKYFAAGGDLVDLASVRTDDEINAMADHARGALDAVRECPVPIVAYMNGDALGGGSELAVACDMRVFAAHARLGYIQGRMGITSAWGGGADLCALVGPARAMRMMGRAEMVNAALALAWGLADLEARDGPDGEDMTAFLKPLLLLSPLVLRGIKAQTSAWRAGQPLAPRRAVERSHLLATWASAEHWAAVDRFLSKEKK
ncbi:MAG: enoyl-CoA hydratase/isomerase family protein [Betaproteobacteria bacterium]|nr:enoyl-CoA hydratase/isomerase family protein [Betaproteobacteria bacterium]